MAAQYADESLPARHESGWHFPLDNGDYQVRIVQMFDPDMAEALSAEAPHFVIEVQAGAAETTQNVAWFMA